MLRDEGFIWRVANRGLVVQDRRPVVVDLTLAVAPGNTLGPWESTCQHAGVAGQMVMTGVHQEPAAVDVAEALDLRTGDPVVVRSRHATIDGQAVQLDTALYPLALVDGTPVARSGKNVGGIYAALTEAGMVPAVIARQVVGSRPASDDEATQLKLPRGAWVLTVERVTNDAHGRPVELLRFVANPLRVRLLEEGLPLTPPA
ncbi:GntR family transcriptional regulator [Streptosporangium sp. NBC_01756]|uniref:GntR family transcriptional regulator n=1 Tax=Streptosporangium sp. NBC_01756 TaxID=2975950 RepID=UPI002DDC009F|nr:GntR family transcriptional regulator [Streptosporangium sp. NBC_01756]WSC86227.1 GntR family transcriptional regulator [Streptosporangium sp. NBC_01756]